MLNEWLVCRATAAANSISLPSFHYGNKIKLRYGCAKATMNLKWWNEMRVSHFIHQIKFYCWWVLWLRHVYVIHFVNSNFTPSFHLLVSFELHSVNYFVFFLISFIFYSYTFIMIFIKIFLNSAMNLNRISCYIGTS